MSEKVYQSIRYLQKIATVLIVSMKMKTKRREKNVQIIAHIINQAGYLNSLSKMTIHTQMKEKSSVGDEMCTYTHRHACNLIQTEKYCTIFIGAAASTLQNTEIPTIIFPATLLVSSVMTFVNRPWSSQVESNSNISLIPNNLPRISM